ncbi:hypothetical protein [Azospirillum sp. Marseille-Q6669]
MIKTCSATRFPGDSQRADNGPVDSATLPGASTRNDGALFTVLRRDLGEAAFRDVLAALDEEMERRLRSLQQEPWDWPGIRNDTQAMLSLAAGFGFATLAALSRTVLSTGRHPSSHLTEVLLSTDIPNCPPGDTRICPPVAPLKRWSVEAPQRASAEARCGAFREAGSCRLGW